MTPMVERSLSVQWSHLTDDVEVEIEHCPPTGQARTDRSAVFDKI